MPCILVVDDDDSTGQLLRMILADSGVSEVRCVSRGREAATLIEASPPDLVIIDLHLPDIDGVSLIQEARARGYTGAVLVLSGSSTSDPLMQRLRSDVDGVAFLQKPFDLDDVVRRVTALLPPGAAETEPTARSS